MNPLPNTPATPEEVVKFELPGDYVVPQLVIHHPNEVYYARVDQDFAGGVDVVPEITYSEGNGELSDVLPNMAFWVSGIGYGSKDKGVGRMRKSPSGTKFFIELTSDINFEEGDYITVMDYFPLRARTLRRVEETLYVDYDLPFEGFSNGGVVPRVGPLVSILKLPPGGTVDFHPLDPSLSEAYDGASVVSYLYEAPGASATSGLDTTSPVFTYDTPGEYRWGLAITDSLGRETVTHRRLFVSPPLVDFEIEESPTGDLFSGRWSFVVRCFDPIEIFDGALVSLYEYRAFYGSHEGSIGKLPGYENLIVTGWVVGESINYDSETGDTTFRVEGPGYWLERLAVDPVDLFDTPTPTSWEHIANLTVDKALAFITLYSSNAALVMDCFFTGSEVRISHLSQSSGTLLNQMLATAMDTVFARPLCNSYGQLFIEIDQQLISSADRATLPVIMSITPNLRSDRLEIFIDHPISRVNLVELSAAKSYDGVEGVPLSRVYSKAPGISTRVFGDPVMYEDYCVEDQDECNRIAGDLLALENQVYSSLEVELGSNIKLFDIAPRQWATISVSSEESSGQVFWVDQRLIPRRVELNYQNGVCIPNVDFEVETQGTPGITYFPPAPQEENYNFDLDIPSFDDLDFPDLGNFFPPLVPEELTTPCDHFVANSFPLTWTPMELIGSTDQRIANAYFPCMLRGGMSGNLGSASQITIAALFFAGAGTNYALYGVKNGSRVITATLDDTFPIARFFPVGDVEVDGFEIELAAGMGSPISYEAGEVIGGGTINATQPVGNGLTIEGMTVGEYYAIDGAGGPWDTGGTPGGPCYFFALNQTGRVGYDGRTDVFSLSTPSAGIVPAVQISQFYGRVFIQKGAGNIGFGLGEPTPDNNSGTMSYILRKAYQIGRRIRFTGPSTLRNVCAI